jgi:hypothetical protein
MVAVRKDRQFLNLPFRFRAQLAELRLRFSWSNRAHLEFRNTLFKGGNTVVSHTTFGFLTLFA